MKMTKRFALAILSIIICVCTVVTFAGCASKKKVEAEVGGVEEKVNTVSEQIAAINGSIDDLKAVDTALDGYVKTLEGKADADAAAIAELKAYDAALESKIAALEETAKTLAAKDWVNATFATLEQYSAVQTELASIKTTLENDYAEVTDLVAAIATAEEDMKAWVNKTLAEGYYNIAEIDGKLLQIEGKYSNSDNLLKKDIEAQAEALEQAKVDLTEAYTNAITKAINDNNGVIRGEIAEAIQNALNTVDGKLAVINNSISEIKQDIENMKNSIATIEQQIKNINNSIEDLENVDSALQNYINVLQDQADDLQTQLDNNAAADEATKKDILDRISSINNLIDQLKAKDEELNQKIVDLQNYVNDELNTTKSWIESTFATIAKYNEVQADIAGIKVSVENLINKDSELSAAITACESSMKTWVNEKLADGYYDIATIDAKINELMVADGTLQTAIDAQVTALEAAKNQLTADYKAAIEAAIEENNGVLDTKITMSIAAAKAEIKDITDAIQDLVDALTGRVDDLEDKVSDLENAIADLQTQINCSNGKHVVDNATANNDVTHSYECTACRTTVVERHTFNEGVCACGFNEADVTLPEVSDPVEIPKYNVTESESVGDGDVNVTIPAEVINNLPSSVTSVSLAYAEPALDATNNTITFTAVELVDQNGDVIDLSGNTAGNLTVTLPVDGFADGTAVAIYHDGVLMGWAEVVDGAITYEVAHLCEITLNKADYVTTFEELQVAVNNGSCVVLANDIVMTESVYISNTVHLYLNNYDLDASSIQSDRPFHMNDGASVTVNAEGSDVKVGDYGFINIPSDCKTATIVINGGSFTGNTSAGALVRVRYGNENVNVTLENVKYTDESNSGYVISSDGFSGSGKFIVNGGEYSANFGFQICSFDATFTGVTINTKGSGFEISGADATIKNCEINVDPGVTVVNAPGAGIAVSYDGVATVEGTTFTGAMKAVYYVYNSGGTITANGNNVEDAECAMNLWVDDATSQQTATGSITIDGEQVSPAV